MPVPPDYSCSACRSTRHEQVPNASFELWIGGVHNSDRDPSGVVAMCLDCGRLDFFVSDPAGFVERQRNTKSSRLQRRLRNR